MIDAMLMGTVTAMQRNKEHALAIETVDAALRDRCHAAGGQIAERDIAPLLRQAQLWYAELPETEAQQKLAEAVQLYRSAAASSASRRSR